MTKQEARIRKLFCSLESYKENHQQGTVSFTLEYHPNFKDLHALSKILETAEIDTQNYTNRGCPTCGPDMYCEIECREVKF